MFDETLLDSAPSHAPVLNNVHWIISLVVAAAGYLSGSYLLPMLTGADEKVIVTQSIIFGVLVGSYALMLCYVYADSRHFGFSTVLWMVVTFFTYVVGFCFYLVYSASKTGQWKRATMPLAYIVEVIMVGALVLYPLIEYGELPKSTLMVSLTAPPPPPPPPPPPAAAPPKVVIHRVTVEDIMKAPTVIPKTITPIKDQPEPPPQAAVGVVGGVPGGVPGGSAGGVIGGIIGGVGTAPPPPPPKAATPKRIRVGGQVESAKLIFQPKPDYPPLAKMARIQGTVRLEAVISKDGTIQDLKTVSGHPLLVKAALDAVQRWRYQPTLLNGEPVEVVTEIDVNFTLAE
ncbi:MAG TPA: energy transducer TonB [Terriglobia bacterium]|nr:energy transducer TonB [Terriglobia bacterium]